MTRQLEDSILVIRNEAVGLDAGGELVGRPRSRFGREVERLKPEAAQRAAA
jgi:hypothetical protein